LHAKRFLAPTRLMRWINPQVQCSSTDIVV